MKQRPRIYYTESQEKLMWDHWQKGDSLQHIAQPATPGGPAMTPAPLLVPSFRKLINITTLPGAVKTTQQPLKVLWTGQKERFLRR